MDSIRLDKWLWAARFFKTRSAAAKAVSGGHVQVSGERVKPARKIRLEDTIRVRKGVDTWLITVKHLHDKRRPYSETQHWYTEDEHQRAEREAEVEMRRLHGVNVPKRKPDKRERRQLDAFKQRW